MAAGATGDPARAPRTVSQARVLVRARARQGVARVRRATVPVLIASVAAGVAYAVAHLGLGHATPFFAPVSAWVALGFSADRQPRRVAELAIGVAVGVLLGDLLVHGIGTGPAQIALVLAAAALVGRFVDRGDLLATQAGVQAIVIVALPAAQSGGPVDRWLDALVGGAVALAVAVLSPLDPRRRVRSLAQEGVTEVADLLRLLQRGLRTGDTADVEEALVRGRASSGVLDQWRTTADGALRAARVSPALRRHRPELADLESAAVLADRAMRNARVLARRCRPVVAAGTHDTVALADLVDEVAAAADLLAAALGSGTGVLRAREALTTAARRTDPWAVSGDDWQVQGMVLLLRSLVVDLLEAAAVDPAEARDQLPEL